MGVTSKVFDYIAMEQRRQETTVELIASENFTSEAVCRAVGSCLTNKYSEGYPAHREMGNQGRYYGGCLVVDELETYCIAKWREVFHTDYHVNVQPHSGTSANLAAYMALLQPGDRILSMSLANGGHLSHGLPVNASGRLYDIAAYDVDENGLIDYDGMERLARELKPRLIIAGASAYSRTIDFARFAQAAQAAGAYFMADIAHIAGLVAAGEHPSPFGLADVVTTTTHKTLRGPRGGIILMGKDFDNPWGYTTPKGVVKKMSQLLNSAVFPGIQGGPLEHVIAAKAVAFGEALAPEYKEYQAQVQKNAKAMAEAFVKRGYKIVSGGTDNHLMLVDLRTKFPELTGKLAERCLVAADITTNKNMVPFDSRSPFQTSGLRFGTPAITTRGLKEDKMDYIVGLIDRVLCDPENEENIAAVRRDVNALMADYPLFAW